MQRNIKNKVTFFTFGLLAGVTLGVVFGVAIKELFGHLNALRSSLVSLGSKEDKMAQRIDSLEGKISSQDKKTVVMVVKDNAKAPQAASAISKEKSSDSVAAKKAIKDGRDSVLNLELNNDSNVNTNVVVMTNQLVTVSKVALVNMDSIQDKKSAAAQKSDSLITSMNEMGQTVSTPSSYRIEYWVSPINFRGYKMSLGKIILYGVSTKAPLKLVKWDDAYYLQSDQMVYRLDYTDDLRPFDRVTDKTILKKFSL